VGFTHATKFTSVNAQDGWYKTAVGIADVFLGMTARVVRMRAGGDDVHLALLEALNQFDYPRCLRQYQREIWSSGQFSIKDQRSGAGLVCDATLYLQNKTFAWRFPTPRGAVWLISSGISSGYSIDALYESVSNTVYLAPDGNEALTTMMAPYLEKNLAPFGPVRTHLVAGHANFAHFIWNELPALLALEGQPSRIDAVWAMFEPILPLRQLVQFPADVALRQINPAYLGYPHASLHTGVLFSVGSTLVTKATQSRVITSCLNYAGTPPPAEEGAKRIWLSLRLLYRHPINQLEAFRSFLSCLAGSSGRYEILLDGYSLPHDLTQPGRHDVARENSYNEAVAELARALTESVQSHNLKIIDLTRLNLPTVIAWTPSVDVYVCHHGTQQHKIGWLSSAPGLIHVSLYFLADRPEGWVAGQAEGSALPRYLPAQYVEDCGSDNPRQHNPFFADYRFSDPHGAGVAMAAAVLDMLNIATPRSEGAEGT
jgi:hypothetical protein